MSDTNPLALGINTSEGKLALLGTFVGFILEALAAFIHQQQEAGTAPSWFSIALVVIGGLMQLGTWLGYIKSRTAVKTAALTGKTP